MGTPIPPKLAQPAQRALKAKGISALEQLKDHTEAEIKTLHGMGPNAMQKLRDAMSELGISFATKDT